MSSFRPHKLDKYLEKGISNPFKSLNRDLGVDVVHEWPRLNIDNADAMFGIGELLNGQRFGTSEDTRALHQRFEHQPAENEGLKVGAILPDSFPVEHLYKVSMFRNHYVAELTKLADSIGQYAEKGELLESHKILAFVRNNHANFEEFLFPTLADYVSQHTQTISHTDIEEIYEEHLERYEELKRDPAIYHLSEKYEYSRTPSEKIRLEKLQREIDKTKRSLFPKNLNQFYEANRSEIDKRFAHKNNVTSVAGEFEDWKAFIVENRPLASSFFFKPISFYIPLSALNTHAYITGASGSGKSELLKLIANEILEAKAPALAEKSNLVVIDPHGDLAEEIAHLEAGWKDGNPKFEYFNPALFTDKSPVIDVFYSSPNESVDMLERRVDFLITAFKEMLVDASISAQMETILKPCLAVLFHRKGSTISDLRRFMSDDENADLVEAGKRLPNPAQANFFRSDFFAKQYDTTKVSIRTRLLSLLNSNIFRRVVSSRHTSQNFLDLEACLNGSKSIIFNLSKATLGEDVSSTLGRLIIAQIKALAYARDPTPKHLRKLTFIIIDEASNFVGPSISKMLTELRKYGCSLIFANQIVGQDVNAQTKDIFLSNTGVKIAGKNGEKSLSILAAEMGADKEKLKTLTGGVFMAKIKEEFGKKATQPFVFRADSSLVNGRRSISHHVFKERKLEFARIYTENNAIDSAWKKANGMGDAESYPKNEINPSSESDWKPKHTL
jgi:DNA helicase HerA-like ATPase